MKTKQKNTFDPEGRPDIAFCTCGMEHRRINGFWFIPGVSRNFSQFGGGGFSIRITNPQRIAYLDNLADSKFQA